MKTLSLHRHVSLTSSLNQIDSLSGYFAFFQKELNLVIQSNTTDMTKPVFFQNLNNASLVFLTNSVCLINSNSSNVNMNTINFPMMDNSLVNASTFTINNVLHFNSFIVPSYF